MPDYFVKKGSRFLANLRMIKGKVMGYQFWGKRLFDIWNKEYTRNCKKDANDECREAIKFILKRNILCGDALTLKASDDVPIVFSEWSLVSGAMIKRRDFRLDRMLEGHQEQISIFMIGWEYDKEIQAFIPTPIREFPLTHYRRIQQYDE